MQSSVLFLLAFALLAIAAHVQLQPEQDARDIVKREVAPATALVAAIDAIGAVVDSENIGWTVDSTNVGWTVDGNNYYWVITGTHIGPAVAAATGV